MPRQQQAKQIDQRVWPVDQRVYLAVPRERKDEAKKMGSRWDPDAQSWYYTAGLDAQHARRLYDTWFDQAHHDKVWQHYELEPAPIPQPRIPTKAKVAKDINGFITGLLPDTKPAPAVQATVNGFLAANAPAAPASQPDADDDDVPPQQRELERLLQAMAQSQLGDSYVTTLHGVAACYVNKDNQNHILMASEKASKDDDMIAVAIMQAKNLFGDAIEITGDADFQRRALSVIQKYGIEVVVTHPKQQELYEQIKQERAAREQAQSKDADKDTAAPAAAPSPQSAQQVEQEPQQQQTQPEQTAARTQEADTRAASISDEDMQVARQLRRYRQEMPWPPYRSAIKMSGFGSSIVVWASDWTEQAHVYAVTSSTGTKADGFPRYRECHASEQPDAFAVCAIGRFDDDKILASFSDEAQARTFAHRLNVIDAHATLDPLQRAEKFARLALQEQQTEQQPQEEQKEVPPTPTPQPEQRPQQNFPRMGM